MTASRKRSFRDELGLVPLTNIPPTWPAFLHTSNERGGLNNGPRGRFPFDPVAESEPDGGRVWPPEPLETEQALPSGGRRPIPRPRPTAWADVGIIYRSPIPLPEEAKSHLGALALGPPGSPRFGGHVSPA